MANANLFQQYLQPVRSVVDYQNDYAKADALKNQNALQSLSLQQAASVQSQRNALRDLVQSGQVDLNDPAGLQKAVAVAPDVAPALAKTIQDQKTSAALAEKDTAQAGNFKADAGKTTQGTQIEAHNQQLQKLAAVNSPDDAFAWMLDGVQNGSLPKQGLQQGIAALQAATQDPTGAAFKQWKQQTASTGMTVQQQLQETTAKPTEVRLGNAVKTIDMNPNSATFGKEVVSQQAIGVSPDTVATQAGENSRAAAGRQTQLQVAGMAPGGGISAPLEAEAQMIASGRMPPPTGMAATRPAAAMLMSRVGQINPDYDASSYGAKTKAAKDFSSGAQGNAMRSFAVAGQHLDQLGKLVDALDNGDNHTINQVGNAISAWNGSTPVTNFDAAKDVVSKEVIKAIVGSGAGGVAERSELAHLMSDAKSPQQLKGIISQYTSLMGAQHQALLAQRRAAGLPDTTLPNYGDAPAAANTAPAGWSYLGTVPGGK